MRLGPTRTNSGMWTVLGLASLAAGLLLSILLAGVSATPADPVRPKTRLAPAIQTQPAEDATPDGSGCEARRMKRL